MISNLMFNPIFMFLIIPWLFILWKPSCSIKLDDENGRKTPHHYRFKWQILCNIGQNLLLWYEGCVRNTLIPTYEMLDTDGGVTCLQFVNDWHGHNYVHTRIILTNAETWNILWLGQLNEWGGKYGCQSCQVISYWLTVWYLHQYFDELKIKLFGICGCG